MSKYEAKEKIRKEMTEISGAHGKQLGQQILDMLDTGRIGSAEADKLMPTAKTLKDCKKSMDEFAKAHKEGGESVVTSQQAEKIIMDYYGIKNTNDIKQSPDHIDILDLI